MTALIPLSLSTDARPKLTENVLQEFLRDRFRGVGGALEIKQLFLFFDFSEIFKILTYVACLDATVDCIRDETCDGGRLKVILAVPSSGCITVLFVNV